MRVEKTVTVKEEVKVTTVKVPAFTVTLDEAEATVLLDLLGQVHAGAGRSKALSELRGSLLKAGATRGKYSWDSDKDFTGTIKFTR